MVVVSIYDWKEPEFAIDTGAWGQPHNYARSIFGESA